MTKIFATLLLAAGTLHASAISYTIAVDTSAISGMGGYLDFQFNPGLGTSDAATATISGFDTDGALTGALPDMGDVSGLLPGTVEIENTDSLNDHTEGFTFGSFFDVFVDLDVPDISGMANAGNVFALSALDAGFNQLLTNNPADPNTPLVQVNLDTSGLPSVTNNSSASQASVAATPEPASLALCALGGGLLLAGSLWRQRRPVLPQ